MVKCGEFQGFMGVEPNPQNTTQTKIHPAKGNTHRMVVIFLFTISLSENCFLPLKPSLKSMRGCRSAEKGELVEVVNMSQFSHLCVYG